MRYWLTFSLMALAGCSTIKETGSALAEAGERVMESGAPEQALSGNWIGAAITGGLAVLGYGGYRYKNRNKQAADDGSTTSD